MGFMNLFSAAYIQILILYTLNQQVNCCVMDPTRVQFPSLLSYALFMAAFVHLTSPRHYYFIVARFPFLLCYLQVCPPKNWLMHRTLF